MSSGDDKRATFWLVFAFAWAIFTIGILVGNHQGLSIHYRIAIGPNAGRKALTLRTVPPQPEPFVSTLLAKQPFRDGTTHVVLDPLDLIARLAALVPRPRLNLTRFHGVFAPNCRHRESVVPKRNHDEEKPDKPLAPMTWMQRRVTDH